MVVKTLMSAWPLFYIGVLTEVYGAKPRLKDGSSCCGFDKMGRVFVNLYIFLV